MGDQKIITLQEIFYDLYFQISYSFLRPWPRICCNYHPPDTNESSALMSDRLLRVQMLHIVCDQGWRAGSPGLTTRACLVICARASVVITQADTTSDSDHREEGGQGAERSL